MISRNSFYGWKIVAVCLVFATIAWSLGVFGMGVYIYALTERGSMPISHVSAAVTCSYLVSALLMVGVGAYISSKGPRPVILAGAVCLAIGIAALPLCIEAWHVYCAFIVLGIGMACISTITIGTTLAPWFERHQGKAMSTAMLGASVGGMLGTPLLMAGIDTWGFGPTSLIAAAAALVITVPLVLLVLKAKPADVSQFPDGAIEMNTSSQPAMEAVWSRHEAWRTVRFRTHAFAFATGLIAQVGFLSHHVSIGLPVVGATGAAAAVSSAAVSAFVGRLLLAHYADRIDTRVAGAAVLLLAATSVVGLAFSSTSIAFFILSITFGITVGNVTTLAPIIVRQEFGAASFSTVFGMTATITQLSMAFGPLLFGLLREVSGSYTTVLAVCGLLDVLAAAVLLAGRPRPAQQW